jgi:multidrug transporter EmrE-like cation transporter
MTTSLWSIILVIVLTVIGSFGSLFLKLGSKTFSFNPVKLLKNYKLIIGFLLYGIAVPLFIIALKGGELSVLYPLVSLSYIWISIISIKFLGEKMNVLKWTGIAMIILGVSLASIS